MSATPPSKVSVEELFRDHASFVAGFLHRLGVDDSEVEDVVQQVFLVVHQKGGYEPGPATPRTWLGAIAVRLAAASRRTAHRLRQREDYDQAAIDAAASRGKSPEEAIVIRDSMWRVQRALNALDFEHRATFILFELEGATCPEIAEAMQVPVGTVYSRLHHARRRFEKAHAKVVEGERSKRSKRTEVA